MGFKRNERFDRYTPRTPKGRLRNHFKFYQPVGGLKHQIRLMTRAAFQWGVALENQRGKTKERDEAKPIRSELNTHYAPHEFDLMLIYLFVCPMIFLSAGIPFLFFFALFTPACCLRLLASWLTAIIGKVFI